MEKLFNRKESLQPFQSCRGVIRNMSRCFLYNKGMSRVIHMDDATFQAFLDIVEFDLENVHCTTNRRLEQVETFEDGSSYAPYKVLMYYFMEQELDTTFNLDQTPSCIMSDSDSSSSSSHPVS